jgi:hypothetical protein
MIYFKGKLFLEIITFRWTWKGWMEKCQKKIMIERIKEEDEEK